MENLLVAMSTFPNAEVANATVEQLLLERLIACCTVIPGAVSSYWWDDKIEQVTEVQTFFKLPESHLACFTTRLLELHPYDIPELIVLPASSTAAYAGWVSSSVR